LSRATLLPLGPQWTLDPPLAWAPGEAGSAAPAGAPDRPAGGVAGEAGSGAAAGEGLWLLSGGTLFLQGSLAHRGELLPKLAKRATAAFHPSEAAKLGLAEGEPVRLEGPAGSLELPVRLDDSVPPGAVFVPYAHAEVELNRLGVPSGAGLRVRALQAAAAGGLAAVLAET